MTFFKIKYPLLLVAARQVPIHKEEWQSFMRGGKLIDPQARNECIGFTAWLDDKEWKFEGNMHGVFFNDSEGIRRDVTFGDYICIDSNGQPHALSRQLFESLYEPATPN